MELGGSLVKFFDGPFPLDYFYCAHRIPQSGPISLFGGNIQTGIINILNAGQDREKVLDMWEKQVRKGYIKKVQDLQANGPAIEIMGQNPNTVFITSPMGLHQTLGIRLPNLTISVKNLRKPFMFDIMILDDKKLRRRLRYSNRQSTSRIKPALSYIPLRLEDGWNQININLQDMVFRTFGTNYRETIRLQIHGNCRLRRVLFSENACEDKDAISTSLPADLMAFVTKTASGQQRTGTANNM